MIRLLTLLAAALIAFPACAEDTSGPSEETPYVISPSVVVDTMLEMARVTGKDHLVDLGSGDGRIVIEAARRFGTRGYGVDYDPRLVKLATDNARRAGVSKLADFYERDIFKTDFSDASVVTMYLLPEYNALLKPKLLALKPGTRIVSHDYGIDDWPPDAERVIPVPDKPVGPRKESVIYAWTVPAKVEGKWRARIQMPGGSTEVEFEFSQRYQSFAGHARIGDRDVKLVGTRLIGEHLSFGMDLDSVRLDFRARVLGDRISGEMLSRGERPKAWQASKF